MERRRRLASAERVRELLDSAFASRYHDHATMLTLSSTAVVLAEEKSQELPPDLVVALAPVSERQTRSASVMKNGRSERRGLVETWRNSWMTCGVSTTAAKLDLKEAYPI
jgi:hypothetical protein